MKTFTGFLVLLLSALASSSAYAGGAWTSVTITAIYDYTKEGNANNIVIVTFSANSTGSASCATNKGDAIIDTSTTAGALAATTAHMARASGGTVSADGAGSCGLYSGIETLADIRAP